MQPETDRLRRSEAEARWLRLRWACAGDETQAAAVLRLILAGELTMDSRLRRSAAA